MSVSLSFDEIDDLIYSARTGDLEALKADITALGTTHNCAASAVIQAAVDIEDESEGGTGACLLHWPAANGNIDILKYLLDKIATTTERNGSSLPSQAEQPRVAPVPLINHRNNAGNTPLHWAALNAHLDCVKALVEAGADIGAKNNAGHDAAFLAERTGWKPQSEAEDAASDGGASGAPDDKMSPGLLVAEWLLERGPRTGQERGEGEEGLGNGGEDGDEVRGDEMEMVVKTGME